MGRDWAQTPWAVEVQMTQTTAFDLYNKTGSAQFIAATSVIPSNDPKARHGPTGNLCQ
jgi:hypothetical protein